MQYCCYGGVYGFDMHKASSMLSQSHYEADLIAIELYHILFSQAKDLICSYLTKMLISYVMVSFQGSIWVHPLAHDKVIWLYIGFSCFV